MPQFPADMTLPGLQGPIINEKLISTSSYSFLEYNIYIYIPNLGYPMLSLQRCLPSVKHLRIGRTEQCHLKRELSSPSQSPPSVEKIPFKKDRGFHFKQYIHEINAQNMYSVV